MTALRSVAGKISSAVVRWASPGCRDWAEGLEREVAFIESDWRALGWAVGSMRVVLDRRQALQPSLKLTPRAPSVIDWSGWLLYLSAGFNFCVEMLTSTGWQHRLGWGMALVACGYWAACSVFDWLRERWEPPTSDIQAYRLFLREGLELKLARYRTVRRWVPRLACLFALAGYALIVGGDVHWRGQLFWVLVIRLRWPEAPAVIQGRIERMDALIAGWQPGNLKLNAKRVHSEHWGQSQTPRPGLCEGPVRR